MATVEDQYQQANEHLAAGRSSEAERLLRQVVAADPRHAEAWHQLGCIAVQRQHTEAAAQCFVRAIRLDGGRAAYHNNLGNCLRMLGKMAEAEASFKQAIRLQENFGAAWLNLTFLLYAQGRATEAEQHAARALALAHESAEEHCACGALLLMRGEFERGWAEHDWRLALPHSRWKSLTGPRWDGQPLEGQTVLLFAEGGMGDTLHFVRYAPLVAARGARAVLWVRGALVPLLRTAGFEPLVPLEEPPPAYDFHCALASLPRVFQTTLESIPREVPYLRADRELTAQWRERLADVGGFRVGICWQGNPAYSRDRTRSVPLAQFRALADVPGVRLVSLQKDAGLDQLADVAGQFDVHHLGPQYDLESGAFMNAAAVMQHLDLVVTPDTAVAHLAGALGVKVWTALSVEPDWRWMLARSDSPWYPTMRLFRQRRPGQWQEVFAEMAQSLSAMVAARQGAPRP
jgi:hypothetical protein